MNATRRPTTILGLTMLGLAIGLWAWTGPEPAASQRTQIQRVRVAPAEGTAVRRTSRFAGVTRAAQRAVLAFPVPARLASRPVEVGQHVDRGQVVASLDSQGFRNARDAAQASELSARVGLSQAERDQQRVERLVASKAATPEELEHVVAAADAARATHGAAAAQLAEARRVLGEASALRAPYAGTITAVMAQPGEFVGAGTPIAELSGDGTIELKVEVSESVVGSIKPGQPADVVLPLADGAHVAGRIVSVAHAAVGPGRLFPVLVALGPNPMLRAGLTAELLVTQGIDGALAVPLSAILDPGASDPALFVLTGDRVARRSVRVADLADGRVVVSGDLKAGEQVVVAGHTRLVDGDRVEVQR
jgi:RND family efflux transporter MFP subunit